MSRASSARSASNRRPKSGGAGLLPPALRSLGSGDVNHGQGGTFPSARLAAAPAVPGDEEPLPLLVQRGTERAVERVAVLVPEVAVEERKNLALAGVQIVLHDRRAVRRGAAKCARHVIQVAPGRINLDRRDVLLLGDGARTELLDFPGLDVERPQIGAAAGGAVDRSEER